MTSQTVVEFIREHPSKGREYSIDEAIDAIGFGRFHWCLLAISGVGFAASTVELVMVSLMLPILTQAGWLSGSSLQAASLMTATFVGELAGGLVWGWASDGPWGRRRVFVGTAATAALFAVLSSLSPSLWWMVAARAGLGLGLGGSMAIDFVYFVEFVPAGQRGLRASLIILIGIVGLFYVGLMGWLILPRWRCFMGACAAPGVILAVGRLLWPWETPRYLLGKGRVARAEEVLSDMARWNGRSLPAGTLRPLPMVETPAKADLIPLRVLIDAGLLPQTVSFGALFLLQSFAYYGLTTWFARFAAAYGVTRMGGIGPSVNLMLIAVAELPGLFLTTQLIERWGRRPVLVMNFLGAASMVVLLSLVPHTAIYFNVITSIAYSFIVGVWAGLYVYGPEVFPTTVRSSAFGVCGMMGKIGGFLSPTVFGALWDLGGERGRGLALARWTIAASFLLAGIIAAVSMRETRGRLLPDSHHASKP